jgi:hypothetical protein
MPGSPLCTDVRLAGDFDTRRKCKWCRETYGLTDITAFDPDRQERGHLDCVLQAKGLDPVRAGSS